MLAYAANRPRAALRRSSPNAFLAIGTAHILAIAIIASIKMDLPARLQRDRPTKVVFIDPVQPRATERVPTTLPEARRTVVVPKSDPIPLPLPDLVPVTGANEDIRSEATQFSLPTVSLVGGETRGPELVTPPSALKPPYPRNKLVLEEEAVLSLRLTIDASGRVVAADPVGNADRSFLEAARRHLLAKWRYRPAVKDGRAVVSTIVTRLHFRLDS